MNNICTICFFKSLYKFTNWGLIFGAKLREVMNTGYTNGFQKWIAAQQIWPELQFPATAIPKGTLHILILIARAFAMIRSPLTSKQRTQARQADLLACTSLMVLNHFYYPAIMVQHICSQPWSEDHLRDIHLQGSIVFRETQKVFAKESADGNSVLREKAVPIVAHEDIIGQRFWQSHPRILSWSAWRHCQK